MSLWDCFKEPEDEALKGKTLTEYFTDLDRGSVRLGAAGKIMTAAEAATLLDRGLDFVVIGRAAILHHDFPRRAAADRMFQPTALPVTPEYLRHEGLSDTFVTYMPNWKGFVTDPVGEPAAR